MLTYFQTEYGKYSGPPPKEYRLNEYFIWTLDEENILLTTRSRAWVALTKEEYQLLESGVEANPDLFALLEDLGIILTERNLKDVAIRHAERYGYMNIPPIAFIMVPTNRCNQRCIYCHSKSELATDKSWDMTDEIANKALDFFFSVPRRTNQMRIEFQGGEVLLRYPLVQKIMDDAMARGQRENVELCFTMVSNLTLMTDKIVQDIKQRRNIELATSLDGPQIVHDKQRYFASGKGTHDKVTYWIKRLREEYGIHVGAMPTCTINNLGHEKELIEEYEKHEIPLIPVRQVNFLSPHERAWPVRMSPEEYFESWRTAFEEIIEKHKKGNLFVEGHAASMLKNMLTISQNYMCLRRPCGAGVSQFTVDPHGNIYACDASRSVKEMCCGNVLTHTYDDVIMSEPALVTRSISSERLPKCQSCAFNSFCGHCAVRSIREHGSPLPEGPEDFECETALKMFPYLFKKLLSKEDAAILTQWIE